MIIPADLQVGDKVGIVSTARKISFEEVSSAVKTLKKWGLQVIFGKHLFKEHNQFSGTIDERISDLQMMINDNNIKAILCARGGYGTVQIIDKINFDNLEENPKWIIGYSDATVLHSHLNTIGIASIHATMPINFSSNTSDALLSLKHSLFGLENLYVIPGHQNNKKGVVQGDIIGGNLSILYSLLGSNSDIETTNKILLIEDLDEYLYHIDRMIVNLKRNNKLTNIKGLIVGSFTDIQDNNIPFGKTVEDIIFDYTKEYDFPICFNFPSGHLNDNRAIKLGVKTTMEINKNRVILQQNKSTR